ncbi:MAG: anti-sigma factor antagonist [Lachnospiraceae bacterium]|nr:anti-sigma factor antagonist [Lachnospiraceae bacterium]
MDYRFEKEYGCLFLKMPEELDHHQAEILKEEADTLILEYPVRSLVFDFSDTKFMDSSGIGVIIGRCKNVRFSGGYVKAVHLNEQIQRIIKLSGLGKIMEVE